MANFETAINKVLSWEGGFQANTSDYGNYDAQGNLVGTNYGITAKTLYRVAGIPISYSGMQAMQKDYAKQIYLIGFWNEYKINEVQNQAIATIVLDTFVLFSYPTAINLIRDAINSTLNTNYQNISPQLLNEVSNRAKSEQFVNNLVALRINYHQYRVSQDQSQSIFLKGWTNRANDYSMSITKTITPYLVVGAGCFFLWTVFKKKKKKN